MRQVRLIENRLCDDEFHEEMLDASVWIDTDDGGDVVGNIVIGSASECALTEDGDNVSIYAFKIDTLADDLIDSHASCIGKGDIDYPEFVEKAKSIVNSLRAMADKIENRIKK